LPVPQADCVFKSSDLPGAKGRRAADQAAGSKAGIGGMQRADLTAQ